MANSFSFAEEAQHVNLLPNAADAAGRTSATAASLKNCHKAWLVFEVNQGAANTVLLTPQQASAVAKTGAKVIPVTRIWANQDEAASSTLVRQTDAVSFTTDAALKVKRVVFEIDPSSLDIANGFDCILAITGASIAANITSCSLVTQPLRQGGLGAPNLLVD